MPRDCHAVAVESLMPPFTGPRTTLRQNGVPRGPPPTPLNLPGDDSLDEPCPSEFEAGFQPSSPPPARSRVLPEETPMPFSLNSIPN